MDIYLIRHTKSHIQPGICYGRSDIGLAETFQDELKILKTKIPDIENLKIISSPLKRCTVLAQGLTTTPFLIDTRLAEMNFGEWELMEWRKIMTQDENLYKKWENDYVNLAPPGGETYIGLYKRCSSLFDEVINASDGDYALITHGGIIRALIAHVLNLPLENSFQLAIDIGSVTKVSINGKIRKVHYINR